MQVLIWTLIALVLVVWSGAAWAIASLLGLDPAWLKDLQPAVADMPYGALVERWLPGWRDLALAAMDLAHALLGWAGSAGQWLVGLVWGLGSALIVLAGLVLSLLVGLARKAVAEQAATPPTASGGA